MWILFLLAHVFLRKVTWCGIHSNLKFLLSQVITNPFLPPPWGTRGHQEGADGWDDFCVCMPHGWLWTGTPVVGWTSPEMGAHAPLAAGHRCGYHKVILSEQHTSTHDHKHLLTLSSGWQPVQKWRGKNKTHREVPKIMRPTSSLLK